MKWRQTWWQMPIIPDTQEAEAGGLPNSQPAWTT